MHRAQSVLPGVTSHCTFTVSPKEIEVLTPHTCECDCLCRLSGDDDVVRLGGNLL